MDYIHATLVGIVEGITEFLPISSTAHILLYERITGHAFGEVFNVVIQFGAMLAVVAITPKRLLQNTKTLTIIAAGVLPTLVIGFLAKNAVKSLHDSLAVIAGSLVIGGIFILAFERRLKNKNVGRTITSTRNLTDLSYTEAALIGVAQSIAIIPGISRSAATIYAGLALKLSRVEAVEFSFLLGVPVMAAASAYELFKYRHDVATTPIGTLVVGTFVSFVVALAAVKFLLRYASNHDFTGFGWYRIVAGAVVAYFAMHI